VLSFSINDIGAVGNTIDLIFAGVTYGTLTLHSATGTYDFVGDAAAINALTALDTITLQTTIRVTDSALATADALFTITLNGTNDAPIANDDSTTINEGAISLFNVVFGGSTGMVIDTDAEGDSLTVTGAGDALDASSLQGIGGSATVTAAVPGTFFTDWGAQVTVQSNGLITYNLTSSSAEFNRLAEGETAIDTFTYTIDDGNGGSDTATVSVTITGTNDPITAVNDTIAATEDVALGQSGDLVANDTDVDANDTKTVISVVAGLGTSVMAVAGGFDVDLGQGVIVHVLADGTYTVDAPQSLAATDILSGSFTYTVQDGGGAQSTATVDVTVNGANDDPVVSGNATATVDEDDIGPLMIDLLDNVSDIDIGDILSVGTVTQDVGNSDRDLGGAFTVTGTELSFDPNIFNDLDATDTETLTFTYIVSDNNGGSVSQTIDCHHHYGYG